MTEELELAEYIVDLKRIYETQLRNYLDSHGGNMPPAGSAVRRQLDDLSAKASRARDRLRALGEDSLADQLEHDAADSRAAQAIVDRAARQARTKPRDTGSADTTRELINWRVPVDVTRTPDGTVVSTVSMTGGSTQQTTAPGTLDQYSPGALLSGVFAPFRDFFGETLTVLGDTITGSLRGVQGLTSNFFSLAVSWLPMFFVAFFIIRSLDLDLTLDAGPVKADIGR